MYERLAGEQEANSGHASSCNILVVHYRETAASSAPQLTECLAGLSMAVLQRGFKGSLSSESRFNSRALKPFCTLSAVSMCRGKIHSLLSRYIAMLAPSNFGD